MAPKIKSFIWFVLVFASLFQPMTAIT